MKWYYESNGLPQGPVSGGELRRLKDEGKLGGEVLVWSKGMPDWAPMHSVREFFPGFTPYPHRGLPPLNPPFRPQLQQPATSSNTDALREDEPEARFDFSQLDPFSGHTPSNTSATTHAARPANGAEEVPALECRPQWERCRETGPLGAYMVSLKEILLEPRHTFSHLPRAGGWGLPLGFLILSEFLGNVFMILAVRQIPAGDDGFMMMLRKMPPFEDGGAVLIYSVLGSACMLPLVAVIKAAFLHVPMKVLAGSSHPFATTFRTLCYSLGAGTMLWGIPFMAVSLASGSGEDGVASAALALSMGVVAIWSTYVNIRAMASAHHVSLARASVAILLIPILAGTMLLLLVGAFAAVP